MPLTVLNVISIPERFAETPFKVWTDATIYQVESLCLAFESANQGAKLIEMEMIYMLSILGFIALTDEEAKKISVQEPAKLFNNTINLN